MVSKGYALAYRRYSTAYIAEEDAARTRGLGIWHQHTLERHFTKIIVRLGLPETYMRLWAREVREVVVAQSKVGKEKSFRCAPEYFYA